MTRLVLLLALLLPLAGCTTPGGDPPAADAQPQVFAVDLEGCGLSVVFVPIPASRLAERIPEGWRVLTPAEVGLPADPRGNGNIGIEMFVCEDGYGGSGATAYGSYFVTVEPPAEYVVEGATFHFLKWETLVPGEDARNALVARGVSAFEGTTTYTPRVRMGEGASFVGTMDMNGTHVFRGSAAAPADAAMKNFTFIEYTPLADGQFATWRVTPVSRTMAVGSATLELPPGWARTVIGSASTQGYLLAGETDFTNATLTIPPVRG